MKKFLLVLAIIVALLFIVDTTILKEKGIVEKATETEKLERVPNANELPVGLDSENRAPAFSLINLEGEEVSLDDYKGKKILLNFWATWCPPCKAEMPDMEELYKEYKEKDFVVLAVNMTYSEESQENVVAFVDDNQLTFPVLMDKRGEVGSLYNVNAFPTSYFIDSDGVIRNKVIGSLSKENMYKQMSRLP